ncbi:MAG: hypothetical protein CVV50_04745, partial [Spirochaetae bacterium HGW-Spirochaetae-6]
SREAIIVAREKRTQEQIEKVDKILEEVLNRGKLEKSLVETDQDLGEMAEQKLQLVKDTRGAYKLLQEAKTLFGEAKNTAAQIDKQKSKLEELKEVDQYISQMNKSYDKALEAENLLGVQVEKLRQIAGMHSMLEKGQEMIAALEKDPFVSLYYSEDRQKLIEDFKQFKQFVQENNLEEAEKNKSAYTNLESFFEKMKNEKLALAGSYSALSGKVLSKVKSFYKKDAESYLEKAKRLKEEVNRVYKRGPSPQPEPDENSDYSDSEDMDDDEETVVDDDTTDTTDEDKEADVKEDPKEEASDEEVLSEDDEKRVVEAEKTEVETKKPNNPEDLMLDKLDNLYNDAENHFKNEDYTDSIDKAREAIELAEKMLMLKKAVGDRGMQGQGYFSKDVKFIKYQIKAGDYLWKIAFRKSVYGKAYLWPLIWFANKELISNPHRIFPGTVLQVPIFSK